MELRAFLAHIWTYLLLIGGAVLLAAVTAFTVSSQTEPTYAAEAQLVVSAGLGTETGGTDDVLAAPRVGQSYAVLATTRPVLLEVIDRANLEYTATEMLSRLAVVASLDTPFITIAVTDESPEQAAAAANALADVLVERATIPATELIPLRSLLGVVERAEVPDDPSGPRVFFNTMLAAAAAFVASVMAVAVIVYVRSGPSVSRPVVAK